MSRSPAIAAAMLFTVSVVIAGMIAGTTGILTGITGIGVVIGAASWVILLLHFGPLVIGTIVGVIARMALDLYQRRRP
ncbi:MAG: hypothetical protein K2Y23_10060 [Cyanobacteria bacterium]|nr:hypothetical protein [Cyanobacteriota bacterium]